ncbi:hypothetical protein NQ314_012853 [Rhamnusium bicolor]|uniref:RanBP2-type domain-containing protein n=1 Tax=Rhamnusium bicolor TaxID=1586634 RepID=A0AAV8X9B4_9CUCU|nr:hypothetical protein NQ314_012853 [Rhamnusium bicolor]
MVIMENIYSPHDRFYELWREIENCHLSYLEMEESPEKIDQRNKLEEYIHDFLCVAAHAQKFTFQETGEVLQRSASRKKDFSGYKAATGFNAIQLYAGNLLSQPWRKEYRQIKTYCGFYKHQIEANLVGAEMIFEAMGYKHYGDGILLLEGPICPDRVAAVSKDCLIAYVECQIMKAIWEEISSSFKITWLEVLEFRKSHLCGLEQSIKALIYRHHQRQYQEHTRSYSQGSDPFGNARCQPISIPSTSPVLPINNSFPPLSGLSSHHHVGLPPPPQPMQPYVYTNGYCANNYTTYGPYAYMPYGQPIVKPNTNGYYYTNGFVTPPLPSSYQYPVPTGPLIDLEPHNGTYDIVDSSGHKPRHPEHINNDLHKSKNNNEAKSNAGDRETDKEDSQFENWDYVYRNLESQGYSKDLGERGDVLSPNSQRQAKEGKKIKETNLDEALNNLIVNDRPLKMNEAVKKLEQEKRKLPDNPKLDKQPSPSSSYENVGGPSETVKKPMPNPNKIISYAKTKSLPRDKNSTISEKPIQSKTLDIRKAKEEIVNKLMDYNVTDNSRPDSNKWQCKACTFLNDSVKDICDMCSKSRSTTAEQPMEIGGAECSKCTLVNPKNLKVCEACGASLKNSPTYI